MLCNTSIRSDIQVYEICKTSTSISPIYIYIYIYIYMSFGRSEYVYVLYKYKYVSCERLEQVYVFYKYEYVYELMYELIKNSNIYYCISITIICSL